ncbi:MAG: MmcQ/YjbR family DNA-binding protein [Aestuariivirga sp.]
MWIELVLSPKDFTRICLSYPQAHEKLSYGQPSFFIAKRFFTRLRKEDHGIVLLLDSIDEREMLLEADPKLYFITDHYKNYAYVLARLEVID